MGKIMLVDDDFDVVFLMKKFLETKGHEIKMAFNGDECLEELQDEIYDLVLLDVMMPGMDGWEVCRKIKNDPKRKSITVIIFSVLSDPEDKEKSLEYARADGHLSKDLGFKDVAALVDNLLKRRLPPERLRAISRMNDKVKLI